MARKSILTDHKRVGKKLVPPMAQLPLSFHSHSHDAVPQLIHLALFRSTNNLQSTVEFSRDLAIAANVGDGKAISPLISNFLSLNDARSEAVQDVLSRNHEYLDLMRSFCRIYPECPLLPLLGESVGTWLKQEVLKKLTWTIGEFSDARSKFSTELLSCLYHSALCADVVRLTSEVQVPNFEAIQDYPMTDESRMVASMVRASCNFIIGQGSESVPWISAFWNRGFQLSACK